MKEHILKHLSELFSNYEELVQASSDDLLGRQLEVTKNKTLGEHLWCVIGARESYAKGLDAGEWVGFSCSLKEDDIENKEIVLQYLKQSAEEVLEAVNRVEDWDPERSELLLNLYEHEVMHEGQIIRLVYGLGEQLPSSWVERWA